MTAATLDTTTTARRDYERSEAIHKIADMYYQGWIPEAKHNGQPIEIHVVVATQLEVEEFALSNDIDVSHIRPGDGTQQTVARLTIAPDAVTLVITHIRAAS